MTGVVASDYEGVRSGEVREGRQRRTHGGRHRRKKGGRREMVDLLFGERLTWKGAGHMANDEWMMRRKEDHADQRREADG
jgi:hypothetical protein